MSLEQRIARADERGLAASGLACLDRCLPLLDGDGELLRPLWGSLADGSDWGAPLEKARDALLGLGEHGEAAEDGNGHPAAVRLVAHMLDSAPAERTAEAVRPWAESCSAVSLRVHRLLDPAAEGAPDPAGTGELPPLVAAELRRQITVLELLEDHGKQGLRRALDVSGEGRRVLRAVVSRRARGSAESGV
ncbi:hypothetical protein [Streptomyces malaysiense]|uniref:Uncharacterized protein n=1 Tax=Streptomyces malaysiense TaxID=1428626 RepID=A0A1J4Q6Y0_9ACTN|nr:hypothetical protein [Streptomyces malaysiense]OIK28118.1 hypothetical protein VT52_007640 [Streptomyces malaysiense]